MGERYEEASFINSFPLKAITLSKSELEITSSDEFKNISRMLGGNVVMSDNRGHLVVSNSYGGGILFEPPLFFKGKGFSNWCSSIDFQTGEVKVSGICTGYNELKDRLSEANLSLLKKLYRSYLLSHLEWITFSLNLSACFDEKELKMARERGFIN